MSTTVTRKGQVTIPKAVRDRLNLKPGSAVDFELGGGRHRRAGQGRPQSGAAAQPLRAHPGNRNGPYNDGRAHGARARRTVSDDLCRYQRPRRRGYE